MSAAKKRLAYLLLLCISLLALNNCGDVWLSSKTSPDSQPTNNVPPASPPPADDASKSNEIRFLENRVKGDPDDFVAYNKLAADYLQRLRETGSIDYLSLATRAAQASLKAIPAEQNPGGLTALAQAEYASHNFAAARDDALKLKELAPGKSYPYEILFDALLELGNYDDAQAAFAQMEKLGRGSISTETRLARMSVLRGHVADAQKHLTQALALAVNSSFPSRETAAWCRWQLGETSFSIGDYESAERYYRDSLTTFPDYYRALASMARANCPQ
ncbi:MAG: tetratricopeptide repeat protein [Pyrinomonadaceae bacterium]